MDMTEKEKLLSILKNMLEWEQPTQFDLPMNSATEYKNHVLRHKDHFWGKDCGIGFGMDVYHIAVLMDLVEKS